MEWKTIRIDAASYYKLNELSGLFTYIFGIPFSISNAASWIVGYYYTDNMPRMREVITNPDLVLEMRNKFKNILVDVAKIASPELVNEIMDFIKKQEEQQKEVEEKMKKK